MGKDKLRKWAENKTFPHVFEPPLLPIIQGKELFEKRGRWKEFFGNDQPIVLELGCGKGEYTVGLAHRNPHVNYIGIDVKGHRFHKGAKESFEAGMTNVAFIRMRIEFIEAFFAAGEVDGIWITFCDPQPLDYEGKRRITSPYYIRKYRTFVKKGAALHLKHDNPMVYERALKEWPEEGIQVETSSPDVYGPYLQEQPQEVQDILNIRTFYESMWLEEGKKITYIHAHFP